MSTNQSQPNAHNYASDRRWLTMYYPWLLWRNPPTWAHLPPWYRLFTNTSHKHSLTPASGYLIHPQAGFMEFPSFSFLLFWQFLWPRPVAREEILPAILAQWGTKASVVQRVSHWMSLIISWRHRGSEHLQLQKPNLLRPASLKLWD
jgi:hypothetical protein